MCCWVQDYRVVLPNGNIGTSQGNGLKCGEKHRKVDGSHVVVGADETDYLLQSFRARRLKAVGALRSVWELQIKGVMIIDDFTFM